MKHFLALSCIVILLNIKSFSQQYSFKIDGYKNLSKSMLKPFSKQTPQINLDSLVKIYSYKFKDTLGNAGYKFLPKINYDNMPISKDETGVIYNMPIAKDETGVIYNMPIAK